MPDELGRILEGDKYGGSEVARRLLQELFLDSDFYEGQGSHEEDLTTAALRSVAEEAARRCEDMLAAKAEEWSNLASDHEDDGDPIIAQEASRDAATIEHAAEAIRALIPTAFPEPDCKKPPETEKSPEQVAIEEKQMSERVDVYKVTVCVTDHDAIGESDIRILLENGRLFATVVSTECRSVDWTDDHPLNYDGKLPEAFRALFPEKPRS